MGIGHKGNGWVGSRPGLMPNSRMFYGDVDLILAFLEGTLE